MTEYKETRITQREGGQGQRVVTFKVTQLIWLLAGVLEALIGLRVVFKLIGVNAANPFATFLYSVTDLLVAPFASLTAPLQSGAMVLEVSSIIAMIVYLLIAWAFERLVYVLFYRPRGPVSVRRTMIADQNTPQGESTTVTKTRTPGHL
jgi:uncharacterized protein YggT (Ycf19 family)